VDSLKSALETEDHVLRAEHIDPTDVAPHQGRSTHDNEPPLKGTYPYSCSEGDLMDKNAENGHENILLTDEKIFTIEEEYNNHQNNKVYAQSPVRRRKMFQGCR
jgi:hypothetical protein